jgi:hypothetical protein
MTAIAAKFKKNKRRSKKVLVNSLASKTARQKEIHITNKMKMNGSKTAKMLSVRNKFRKKRRFLREKSVIKKKRCHILLQTVMHTVIHKKHLKKVGTVDNSVYKPKFALTK